jgi:predicted anti-sigma-YlaC factor YlaD
MQVEHHFEIRRMIDRSLEGRAPIQEQQTLREHLATCTPCQEYLDVSRRAIAGLAGFSFEVKPNLYDDVLGVLAQRAQQLTTERARRRPMLWSYVAAFLLTACGSLTALRFSGSAASLFHLPAATMHLGLLALWIVPSLCFCLLFPILSRWNEKGLSNEHW